jgi:hypothetical protein
MAPSTTQPEHEVQTVAVEEAPAPAPSGVRVELSGPFAGHYVYIDVANVTTGFVEALQSNQMKQVLDGLDELLTASDLFAEGGRSAWLRTLKMPEFTAVCQALTLAMAAVPKAS